MVRKPMLLACAGVVVLTAARRLPWVAVVDFAVVAHATRDFQFHVRSELGSLPAYCNAITDNRPPTRSALLRRERRAAWNYQEKSPSLYGEFMHRYTSPGDLVLDFNGGTFASALAALKLQRKWLGFEKNSELFQDAIERLGLHATIHSNVQEMHALGMNEVPTNWPKYVGPPNAPESQERPEKWGDDTPTASELERARIDAAGYGCEIKRSHIRGGWGLYVNIPKMKGSLVGHLWGRCHFAAENPSDRLHCPTIVTTLKYKLERPSLKKEMLFLQGSNCCSARYVVPCTGTDQVRCVTLSSLSLAALILFLCSNPT